MRFASPFADGEDYFAHEDEVIATFYAEINEALAAGHDVIADATHISDRALYNTLKAIRADCKMLLVSLILRLKFVFFVILLVRVESAFRLKLL